MDKQILTDVHRYWFGELRSPADAPPPEKVQAWFRSTAEIDNHIRDTFGHHLDEAKATEWSLSALSREEQVGLIVLMAQIGSFVPATRARIGVVDRLFTRVGASDNLVRGQSTFMVEMSETSAILHTATRRSLVLLDEIGRGTSTYDGISIAWSVSEHLHNAVGCKTIFATHYHELTQLADNLVAVRNYNVQVREVGGQVLFLHRLQPGGADRSYGIEVGRLAGLPPAVLTRATELLRLLEAEQIVPRSGHASPVPTDATDSQLALFGVMTHPVVQQLRNVDPNAMTPIQALEMLARLVDEVKREGGST